LTTAAVALVAATLTAVRVPSLGTSGLVYSYNVLWLWPIATFFWFAVVVAIWQLATAVLRTRRPLPPRAAALGCAVALVIAFLPRVSAAPVNEADARLTRRLSGPVVEHIDGPGPYLVRGVGVAAVLTVVPGLAVALERHGIHTYLQPAFNLPLPPWGPQRNYKGQRVAGTVWVVSGSAQPPRPTAQRIASASGATQAERREVDRLRQSILADIQRAGGITPTKAGSDLLTHAAGDAERAQQTKLRKTLVDPTAMLEDRTLPSLVAAGLVVAPGGDGDALARYGRLRELVSGAWDAVVYLDPSPPS
jgi:hypothetical protein